MKQALSLFNRLVVCGLVLATATVALADQRTAEVVRIKGSARYSMGGNTWQPLKVGTVLSAGAIVQTAQDSTVDIAFTAGMARVHRPTFGEYISYNPTVQRDVVRMTGDTVLAFDKLTSTDTGTETITETELDLRSGELFANVKKVSAASTFEIKIPNGVAGIRGTFVWIRALEFIRVGGGLVAYSYMGAAAPEVVNIPDSFQWNIPEKKLEATPEGAQFPTLTSGVGNPVVVVRDLTVITVTEATPPSGD